MLDEDTEFDRSLGEGTLVALARHIGANPEVTKEAIEAALPASMYAIAERGSTERGAEWLLEAMAIGRAPQLDTKELRRRLADPETHEDTLVTDGRFAEEIFGDRFDSVVEGVRHLSDIDPRGVRELLALTTSLAMGVIGKRAREHNLDSVELARFLAEEKPGVAERLPESLRPTLLRGDLVTAPHAPRVWPWMLGVAAAVSLPLTLPFLTIHTKANMAPLVPLAASVGAVPRSEPSMVRWRLDEVAFTPGQSTMPAEARAVARDLSTQLRANPNAKLRIEVSDSTASSIDDLGLARRRAQALRRELIANGVPAHRVVVAPSR